MKQIASSKMVCLDMLPTSFAYTAHMEFQEVATCHSITFSQKSTNNLLSFMWKEQHCYTVLFESAPTFQVILSPFMLLSLVSQKPQYD